jgi:molybdopterin converting factor small subunit
MMTEETSTVAVRVRFMGDLRAVIGKRDETMTLPQGSTVGDLFASLCRSYGEPFVSRVFSKAGALQHYVVVFVNGENIKEAGGLGRRLEESEVEIIMLPMFEGG